MYSKLRESKEIRLGELQNVQDIKHVRDKKKKEYPNFVSKLTEVHPTSIYAFIEQTPIWKIKNLRTEVQFMAVTDGDPDIPQSF